MTKSELELLTIAELRGLAKKKKVSLPAGGRKADIVSALAAAGKAGKTGAKSKVGAKKSASKKNATAKKARKKTAKKVAKKETSLRSKTGSPKQKKVAPAAGKKRISPSVPGAVRDSSSAGQTGVVGTRRVGTQEWKTPTGREKFIPAQERVADAKYYTGPEALRRSAAGGLSHDYGRDRFVLMPRDPRTVFAYWEVMQQRIDRERSRLGPDSRLCIRIFDVTGVDFDGNNAIAYFDQEIFDRSGSWYFELSRPGHVFCADIGLRVAGGNFLSLVRSNRVSLAREGISGLFEDEGVESNEEIFRLFGFPQLEAGATGRSSAEVQETLRARRLLEISSPGRFRRK